VVFLRMVVSVVVRVLEAMIHGIDQFEQGGCLFKGQDKTVIVGKADKGIVFHRGSPSLTAAEPISAAEMVRPSD